MIIITRSFARAGLIGNPSDGYFGKTISFIVRNFAAEVTLYESPELEILPARRDHSAFDSIGDARRRTVRRSATTAGSGCSRPRSSASTTTASESGIEPARPQLHASATRSNIPPQVGMAGSSAIITACFRALMAFYGVHDPAGRSWPT